MANGDRALGGAAPPDPLHGQSPIRRTGRLMTERLR
jgi:hypothetical protein